MKMSEYFKIRDRILTGLEKMNIEEKDKIYDELTALLEDIEADMGEVK